MTTPIKTLPATILFKILNESGNPQDIHVCRLWHKIIEELPKDFYYGNKDLKDFFENGIVKTGNKTSTILSTYKFLYDKIFPENYNKFNEIINNELDSLSTKFIKLSSFLELSLLDRFLFYNYGYGSQKFKEAGLSKTESITANSDINKFNELINKIRKILGWYIEIKNDDSSTNSLPDFSSILLEHPLCNRDFFQMEEAVEIKNYKCLLFCKNFFLFLMTKSMPEAQSFLNDSEFQDGNLSIERLEYINKILQEYLNYFIVIKALTPEIKTEV